MRKSSLAGLILRRVFGALPVLLIVSLITFGMMRLIPGDPSSVIGGLSATPAQLEQIRKDLGLDEPSPCSCCAGTADCCRAISGGPF